VLRENRAANSSRDDGDELSPQAVEDHLARILNSSLFRRSDRLSRFLEFSVRAALDAEAESAKEYVVGVEVFDRGKSFDPRIDPVVRVEARRLRARLKRWHETEGRDSTIIIDLPRGGYAAQIRRRAANVTGDAPANAEETIAVLPFSNFNAEPELEYFSDGLTEELIHALTSVKGLHIVAWPSVARLKGQQEEVSAVAARLNVKYVLRGSVRSSGRRLRLTAALINAADGHYLWSEAWDRPAADLLAIEEEIAQSIVNKLKLELGPQRDEPQRHARDTESHTLYLKGRFQWNKRTPEGLELAISYFEQVTQRDPEWSFGWAGLAETHAVRASYSIDKAATCLLATRRAAERALALDTHSAPAITCLAFVRAQYDRAWEEAEELYRRAIALNPSYATAHHWYGCDFLALLGRFEEAAAEIDLAVKLDPLSSIIIEGKAWVSMVAGDYEDALRRYLDLTRHDPSFFHSASSLGRMYSLMGRYDEAIDQFNKARALVGDFPKILGALGQTYGLAGRRPEAEEVMSRLREISSTQYVGHCPFALIHLGLGENEAALNRLEAAVDDYEISALNAKIHPAWAGLRHEPRFKSLLRRMRLV